MPRLACLVLLVAVCTVFAADEEVISADLDTFLSMSMIRDAEISPTGTHVAYRVYRNDFDDDRQDEQLWVVPAAGGGPLQLTRGSESVGDYEWSADGRWLAFTRDKAVHLIRLAGGESLTLGIEGVEQVRSLAFAADGSALYFLAVAEADEWANAREEALGEYRVVREEGDYVHLWRQGLSEDMHVEGEAVALTDGESFSVTSFAMSPSGARIAFTAWPTPDLVDLLESKVYTVPAAGGNVLLFADEPGAEGDILWRHDGGRLAFTAAAGFPDYADIVTYRADGTDRRAFDMPDHDAGLLRYDEAGLLFEAAVRTTYGRYRLDFASGKVTALDDSGLHMGSSVSADGSVMASLESIDGGLAEVVVEDAAGARTLTDSDAQLDGLWKPQQTLLHWESFDGLPIEAVLTWPRDYRSERAYPLFVRTHGGPTGTDRPGLMYAPRSIYPPAVLAAQGDGAFVLQTNYRGSASYGDAFQKTNFRQLGIGPARDIIAGIDMLVADGRVDPDRVACLGWSQGGHISAMLSTYSDVCTAAIMGAGISDWRTYYYNTDITQFTTEYFGATPLADDNVYALTSPVTYIDNAGTPTLIQHGENDARVPIANAYQLRQLLQDRGVESRMIVYAGMGHGPRTPRHLRAITAHALAWFEQYLFDGERADFVQPVPPEETDRTDDSDAPSSDPAD